MAKSISKPKVDKPTTKLKRTASRSDTGDTEAKREREQRRHRLWERLRLMDLSFPVRSCTRGTARRTEVVMMEAISGTKAMPVKAEGPTSLLDWNCQRLQKINKQATVQASDQQRDAQQRWQ